MPLYWHLVLISVLLISVLPTLRLDLNTEIRLVSTGLVNTDTAQPREMKERRGGTTVLVAFATLA